MEISMFEMWLLLRLDAIQDFFLIAGTIGCTVTVFVVIPTWCEWAARKMRFLAPALASLASLIFFCMILISVLMPDTKQAATIYLAPKIINSDFVQNDLPSDAGEAYRLMKELLGEMVADYRKEKATP